MAITVNAVCQYLNKFEPDTPFAEALRSEGASDIFKGFFSNRLRNRTFLDEVESLQSFSINVTAEELEGWEKDPQDFWRGNQKETPRSYNWSDATDILRYAILDSKDPNFGPLHEAFVALLAAKVAQRKNHSKAYDLAAKISKDLIFGPELWPDHQMKRWKTLLRTGFDIIKALKELASIQRRTETGVRETETEELDFGPLFFHNTRKMFTHHYRQNTMRIDIMKTLHSKGVLRESQRTKASSIAAKLIGFLSSSLVWNISHPDVDGQHQRLQKKGRTRAPAGAGSRRVAKLARGKGAPRVPSTSAQLPMPLTPLYRERDGLRVLLYAAGTLVDSSATVDGGYRTDTGPVAGVAPTAVNSFRPIGSPSCFRDPELGSGERNLDAMAGSLRASSGMSLNCFENGFETPNMNLNETSGQSNPTVDFGLVIPFEVPNMNLNETSGQSNPTVDFGLEIPFEVPNFYSNPSDHGQERCTFSSSSQAPALGPAVTAYHNLVGSDGR